MLVLFLKDSLEGEGVGDLTTFAFVICCSSIPSISCLDPEVEEKQLHLLRNDLILSMLIVV